ncbi:MAG: ABC transporter substrate-binding protein [Bryobacteraceae bacterium]
MPAPLVLLLLVAAVAPAAGPVRRIVCLSPNDTELLYGLGVFDRVVGVSGYDSYPPKVARLAHVGGWQDPSLEKIVALHPDLIVTEADQAALVESNLHKLGLPLLALPGKTIEDIYTAATRLGRALGMEKQAAELIEHTRAGLDAVRRRTAGLPRPSVAIVVDRTPGTLRDMYAATGGAYLAEAVDIAGGRMALGASPAGYVKLSQETLLTTDPEIVLDLSHNQQGRFAADPKEAWKALPQLRAVRNGRVYCLSQDFVLHASQRIVNTAELFARTIHPEAR